MESLYNGLHRTGQTLETSPTLRLPKRPHSASNPNPKVFEDFGSSFAPRSSQVPPISKFKPARIVSSESTCLITIKKPLADLPESDDELDFLSSSQADPDDPQPSKEAKTGKYTDKKGKGHDYDPKFLPSKSNVLSKMKFTKTKKLVGGDNTTMRPSSSSSKNQPDFKENDQDFGSWVNDLKNQAADIQATQDSTKTRGSSVDNVLEIPSPLRIKSSNRRLIPPRLPAKQPSEPPGPKPRPLPRPKCKANANTGESKPPASSGSGLTTPSSRFKSNAIIVDGRKLFPLGHAKVTMTGPKKKSLPRSPSPDIFISTPVKRDSSPQNFPMDMISPLREKVQQKPEPLLKPTNRNTGAPRKRRAFPMPSPQSSNKVGTSQSKGKNKAQPFPLDDPDESEGDESDCNTVGGKGKASARRRRKSRPKPQAFPMSIQMLTSIGSPSVPKGRLSKHQKRTSEGCSDDERQSKKKRRSSLSPSEYIIEDEGDSITISPDTDPRTLCPYCDTPLPSSPSSFLINILAATRKKSTSDPRPSNPLGLKAPLATFVVACQRHKFESQILPEAEKKGWPKTILWHKLGARVERMKDELQALIEDPGGREVDDVDKEIDEVERLFRDDDAGTRREGPKARSVFWTEVMDEVKKKGSRAVVGVRGQFADFEKTQPGYYGEQGSVIIYQTLFDMFPPASFDPARISPLTSNEFVLRILVPEVALRLIMEDRKLRSDDGVLQALIVLRESSAYGVAMFPEDGGEWGTGKKRGDDVMGVGDKIVMERARKRRKELEEEEEQEGREDARRIAEMDRGLELDEVNEKKRRQKRKGMEREDQRVEEQQAPVERPRSRPRPIMKASSSMSVLSLSDHEETQLPQPSARYKPSRNKGTNRTQSRTRNIYSGMDTDPPSDFSLRPVVDSSVSESDDYHRPASRTEGKARKSSSTRAANKGLGVLNIGFDSDASVGSQPSSKSTVRRPHKNPNAIRKPHSKMDADVDFDDDGMENVLDINTPVRKHSRPSHRRVEGTSNDERTPKPLTFPRTEKSNDLKPLMVARMRQSQKNDSGSKFGGAEVPRRASKLSSEEEAEVVPSPNNNYGWLLNDTSQSSTESSKPSRRY